MWRGVLILIALIGYVAGQETGKAENPVDVKLNDETAVATEAIQHYIGFSCAKGYRCIPVLECLPCEYGTYKDTAGSGLCVACPPDCTTLRKGAESRYECVPFCPPGYELSQCGNTCTKCRPGTYKSGWERTVLCSECPTGSYPPIDRLGLTDEMECYEGEDVPDPSTTESTTTVVDCNATCMAPSNSTDSKLCSPSMKALFMCLKRRSGDCSISPYDELVEFYVEFHQDLKYQIAPKINTGDWEVIYSWFMKQCPVEDVPVSSTTVSITTVVDCNATCMAPSEAESNICSPSMKALFMCLKRRSDDCSISPYDELVEFYVEFHQDLKYQLGPTINTGDWEVIYSWFMNECPECLSDSDCGNGGQCVSGFCGCLTSSCSRLAYVALPGCGRYCQCDIASGEWRQQTCNPISNELFDETINTCNRMDAVEQYICASVQCENPCPSPPTGLTDICSYDVRQYIKCLRNQYIHCGIDPNGISVELYDQLPDLLASGPTLQQGYSEYMSSCLVDECAATCMAPTATESNPCSPSIKALFMCLERRSEVCSVNPSDELLQFYSGFHQDLKNQLTHMVNTGNWEEIYDWFKNECPEDDTTTTYMPITSEGSECLSDSDCGDGGQCVSGFCDCLTSSCSQLAYIALPGCGRYCQCDIASGEWKQQTCNPLSNELFDETINTCNRMESVEPYICASVQCENPCPPTGLTDICSYDVRQYIKCLRNQYIHCGIDPNGISIELYNQLSDLLSSGPTLQQGYNEYLRSCLGGHNTMTDWLSTPTPPVSMDFSSSTHPSPVQCLIDSHCGDGIRCNSGFCDCLTSSCSQLAYAALPGCERFCQCDVASGVWRKHACNPLSNELFDETINTCNRMDTVEPYICASVQCENTCNTPPTGLTDICSYDVRQFIKCLKNQYVHCGIEPSMGWPGISAELSDQLSNLFMSGDDFQLAYSDYLRSCLVGDQSMTGTPSSVPPPSSLSPAECVSSQDCGPGIRCDGGSCVCLNTQCFVESSVALPGCESFCQCDITSGTWQLHYCNVPYLFDETTNSCSIDNTMDIALCASVTCDTGCPSPPSGDVNICSDDVRQFIKCLRNTYIICGSNLLYQRTALSMYLNNELDSLLADVDSLMMGYYEYMQKCLGGWDEANTTVTGSPPPSMPASTPSASGFTSHPTSTETTPSSAWPHEYSTDTHPPSSSTPPSGYSTDTQQPSSSTPTTVPSGTSTETVDASQLSSVQCANDLECGVAGHCYLGNKLCGCLTTNCSGVAYEAMPNCGWYCQCEDATNQWRLQQCSPGTLFDEEKYTCNHGYTVELTVCATEIDCDAPLACPIPASTDVCWFDVRVYVKCLRSKYIKCAIDPTNEINDSNMHVELQNMLYDVSQVEENYQDYMHQCLVYGNYYGSA